MLIALAVSQVVPSRHAEAQVDERTDVIVHFEPGAARLAAKTLIAADGGSVRYEYAILPDAISVRGLTPAALEELAALPGVVWVEKDRLVTADLNDSTPRIRALQDQITAAGLSATGAGVRVCVCDTGINESHIMYAGRVDTAAGYDFVNNDADPADDNGHGSHVAGIAVGGTGITVNFLGGSGNEPLQGVAPEATLIGVKVMDAWGTGQLSDVIAGIDHCASPSLPGGRADVINLSLSDGMQYTSVCDTNSLAIAANNAVSAGVVVVASAGNNGYANALQSPACASGVISVGATYDDPFPNPDFPPYDSFTFCTRRNVFGTCIEECTDVTPAADQVTCYSNKSDMLDVTAPGSYIWSARHDSPNQIVGKHGTSQAAPHVAGLAALLLSVDPTKTPAQIRQLIRDGAVDLGAAGFDPEYGYGRIDVIDTLMLLDQCSVDADCDDALFCNGTETCVAGACVGGTSPCTPQYCREADDTCVDCLVQAHCDDLDPCNGAEICDATGTCQSGPIDDCNGNGVSDSCDINAGTSLDCNANGIPDECDVLTGGSPDCNANGVPDECEPDCNANGSPDDCDIASGTSLDCNGNAIPDECDTAGGTSADCNGNGVPDECEDDCNGNGAPDDCDIAGGTSLDCNGNATPDECDIAAGTSSDCNTNGVPDECEPDCNANGTADGCDLTGGTSQDCNINAVPDECDIAGGTSADCNANGIPDECEPDCNTNGSPDDCDLTGGTSQDCNANGVPDECDPDCNANGAPDECDISGGTSADCNANGAPDECDVAGGGSQDCNINGVPDECELDCNENGVPDDCDLSGGTSQDCNANAVPDECDVAGGTSTDCNANAVPDECEVDCNGNGIADECDISDGTSEDCNTNGVPDECDVTGGGGQDCNANGVPDECEPDCNGNGSPDDCDLAGGTSEDCNANAVPDECDLASGTSEDCNGNALPDECEPDCNGNGVADDCDIAGGTSDDCNANAVPDECDVASGTSEDCNGNDVPDECEDDCDNNGVVDDCQPPVVVGAGAKYITVDPQPRCSATPVALLVTSDDYPCFQMYVDADGYLIDSPIFRSPLEWGRVQIGDLQIVPEHTYEVRAVSAGGQTATVEATTWLWGDVNNNGVKNFNDIFLVVAAFQGDFTSVSLQAADLHPCRPNRAVSFDDINQCVRAFQGHDYAETFCPVPCE